MWWSRRGVLLAAALVAGCGFQPLYGPASPAAAIEGQVAIEPLAGDEGFALTERLLERLGWPEAPTHRLAIEFDLDEEGIAITPDDITTRFRVYGRARYALVPLGGDEPVLAGEVESFTGYSAPASSTVSAYAARVAAEDAEIRLARTLADRIALELALGAGAWAR